MKEGAKDLTMAGTTCALDYFEEVGNLPIRNWYQGTWPEGAEVLTGYATRKTHRVKDYGCGSCPIRCGKVVKAKGGPYDGQEVAGPEYETVGLLGSNCLISDYDVIVKQNEICNRYGVDTIAALKKKSRFMQVTAAGLRESHPHDVVITKEAPNYRLS